MIKQNLHENWEMHTAGWDDWQPAQVPGTVYTDLLRNGNMEDPFWKDNENKALALMENDYEYETIFAFSPVTAFCCALRGWIPLRTSM